MRIVGLLLLLVGLAAVLGDRVTGTPLGEFFIGRYYAVSEARNFNPILVTMREDYAPLGVSLEVTPRAGAYDAGGETVLTMHVVDPDGQMTDQTLRISPKTAYGRDDGTMLLENALTIDPLKSGVYTFQLGNGDRDELGVSEIVLNLKGHAGSFAYDVQPIGFVFTLVGVMVLLLGRRRRLLAARNAQEGTERARPSRTSGIGYKQPEPEPEPKKRQPNITWGRDGDKD